MSKRIVVDKYVYANGAREINGYKAFIGGRPGAWDKGRTIDAAIGALILTHPELFELEVKLPDEKIRK
jgi:hypothetical protein